MGWKLDKKQIETIRPDRAKALLALNTYEGQRPLSKYHLEDLERQFKNKTFRTGSVGLAKCSWDNGTVLVNGQHTLTVAVSLGHIFDATVEYFTCENPIDLADLFATYDHISSGRNIGQLSHIRAAALGLEWSSACREKLLAALVLNIPGASRWQSDQKVELLDGHEREGNFINSLLFIEPSKSKHMQRRSVVAAILRTWAKSQKDALLFWSRVRDGELLTKDQPEYHLHKWLMQHWAYTGNHGIARTMMATDHEYLYRCISAWNAWRNNETRTMTKYFPTSKIPSAI